MDAINPTIKAINALAWGGESLWSDAPVRFDCHLEIGEAGFGGADHFNIAVVNRAWARTHLDRVPEAAPAWLQPRATLMLDSPSFQQLADCVASEIAAIGPYPSWPDFALRLGPYLRWDLGGVLYPPFTPARPRPRRRSRREGSSRLPPASGKRGSSAA